MLSLVTGGSGSGKSEYAEQWACSLWERSEKQGRLIYAAALQPLDGESWKRIERHRKLRADRHFETMECYTHLENLPVREGDVVLVECLSNLTANEMFSPKGRPKRPADRILSGIHCLEEQGAKLVVVGNNVFEDGLAYDKDTMRYLQEMAKLHREIAGEADRVVELVCGIPVYWKKEGEILA